MNSRFFTVDCKVNGGTLCTHTVLISTLCTCAEHRSNRLVLAPFCTCAEHGWYSLGVAAKENGAGGGGSEYN